MWPVYKVQIAETHFIQVKLYILNLRWLSVPSTPIYNFDQSEIYKKESITQIVSTKYPKALHHTILYWNSYSFFFSESMNSGYNL